MMPLNDANLDSPTFQFSILNCHLSLKKIEQFSNRYWFCTPAIGPIIVSAWYRLFVAE